MFENMSAADVLVLVMAAAIGLLFLAVGVMALRGRWWNVLPGHKQLPEEVKDSPKERRFCRMAGVFLIWVAALDLLTMGAKAVGNITLGDWGMRLLLLSFFVYIIIYWKRLMKKQRQDNTYDSGE